jgi:hypothetical protein
MQEKFHTFYMEVTGQLHTSGVLPSAAVAPVHIGQSGYEETPASTGNQAPAHSQPLSAHYIKGIMPDVSTK